MPDYYFQSLSLILIISFSILLNCSQSQDLPELEEDPEDLEYEDADDSVSMNRGNCKCGVRNGNSEISSISKIVGGQIVKEIYPWMSSLLYVGLRKPKLFCGATLINDRYMLTAGHCVHDLESSGFVGGLKNVRVYIGFNELGSKNGSTFQIQSVKIHPRFDSLTLNFDLALIKLPMPLKFKDNIKPICLRQKGVPFVNRDVMVSGWGHQFEGGIATKFLRETKVKVLSNNACKRSYSALNVNILPTMICAKAPGKDSCHGVYTRISSYLKWIKENTKDSIYCKNSFS